MKAEELEPGSGSGYIERYWPREGRKGRLLENRSNRPWQADPAVENSLARGEIQNLHALPL